MCPQHVTVSASPLARAAEVGYNRRMYATHA